MQEGHDLVPGAGGAGGVGGEGGSVSGAGGDALFHGPGHGGGPHEYSAGRSANEEKGIQADSMTRPATAERGIRQVDNHQPPFNYAA